MADKVYRIRVETVANPAGLEQTSEGLEHVHKGFVHAGSGAKEFHALLHRITEIAPEYGLGLRALISPVGGALTLGITAAMTMQESLKQLQASLTVTEWESYNSVIAATVKAFYDSQIEAAQFAAELTKVKNAAETASEQVERLANIHKAQQTAAEKIAEAQEKLEMARASTIQDPIERAEKELEIQNRYAAAADRRAEATERLAKAEEHRKLANEQLTETRLSNELNRARASATGVGSEAGIDERIRVEESRLAAAHADTEKVRAEIEEVDKHPLDPSQFAKLRILRPLLETDESTEDKQRETIKRLKDARPAEVAAIHAANDLVKDLEGQLKATVERIKKLRGDLAEHDVVSGIQSRQRGVVSGIDAQTRGFSAGAGATGAVFESAARIQAGHGSETDYSIVEPVMRYMQANSRNGSQVLALLASQVGINDAHGAALDAIKARLDAQKAQAATRLMPGGNP